MYRVFLADEDATVRQSIRDWLAAEKGRFELVGEAMDGAEALPMIRDLRPDMLIAGLRMPFMDGQALCRAVRRDFPWVQQMLVGGDGPGGVPGCEKLMRPFSRYELFDALERMAGRLRERRGSLRERIARAEESVLPERREAERRFCGWIGVGDEEAFVHRRYLESTALGRLGRVLTVVPGEGAQADVLRGILRLLELEPGNSGVMAAFDMRDVLAMVVSMDEPDALEDSAYAVAYTVLSAAEYFTGVLPRIQVGACVDNLDDMKASFAALSELRRMQLPQRPIFGEGDALTARPGEAGKPCLLGECLACLDVEELGDVLAQFAGMGVLSAAHADSAIRRLEHEVGAECEIPGALRGDPAAMLVHAVRWRDCAAPELAGSPLNLARRYVVRNFSNPGLQIFAAAACAGMSPNRFRQVFHQETGQTFTEYLVRMRINAAKALLAGTRMRVSGIARKVGFSDEKYFGNVFRHMEGMTAKEYRER